MCIRDRYMGPSAGPLPLPPAPAPVPTKPTPSSYLPANTPASTPPPNLKTQAVAARHIPPEKGVDNTLKRDTSLPKPSEPPPRVSEQPLQSRTRRVANSRSPPPSLVVDTNLPVNGINRINISHAANVAYFYSALTNNHPIDGDRNNSPLLRKKDSDHQMSKRSGDISPRIERMHLGPPPHGLISPIPAYASNPGLPTNVHPPPIPMQRRNSVDPESPMPAFKAFRPFLLNNNKDSTPTTPTNAPDPQKAKIVIPINSDLSPSKKGSSSGLDDSGSGEKRSFLAQNALNILYNVSTTPTHARERVPPKQNMSVILPPQRSGPSPQPPPRQSPQLSPRAFDEARAFHPARINLVAKEPARKYEGRFMGERESVQRQGQVIDRLIGFKPTTDPRKRKYLSLIHI
eukprot:TRINITY_DN5701_c0_g1_i2.p1 TRINITY_DN5701_c0_g1~~TRINITY_DN5701_c0_g1_i2.p1  ORF type:complete len:418 (-),score=55.17 TRINITY_DN5701_c0_g1_i2:60-1265(-)